MITLNTLFTYLTHQMITKIFEIILCNILVYIDLIHKKVFKIFESFDLFFYDINCLVCIVNKWRFQLENFKKGRPHSIHTKLFLLCF